MILKQWTRVECGCSGRELLSDAGELLSLSGRSCPECSTLRAAARAHLAREQALQLDLALSASGPTPDTRRYDYVEEASNLDLGEAEFRALARDPYEEGPFREAEDEPF